LFAFDGSRDIQLAGEFPKLLGGAPPLDEVPGLLSYSVRDPSRNLYGAVAQSIEELDRRLAAAQKPVRIGTLVVFSRGPDAAGRLTDQQLRKLLEQTRHHLLAIGLQNTPRDYYLTELGRTETLRAQDEQKLGPTFESAASRVNALYDMYYLVSYCSPARAGVRRLRLQVDFKTPQGDEKRGRVEREFDATGFGPGCDPETPPRFALSAEGQAQATDPRETSPDSKPNSSKAPRPRAPQPADDAADSASDSDTDSIVPPPQKPGYAPRVR
jgi:hypothetical protein